MSKPLILIPVFLAVMLAPVGMSVHATGPTYLAGVTVGQFATYTPVKAVYQSSTAGGEPQMITDLNNTVTAKVTVETVSSPARNVTLQQANTFNNATVSGTEILTIDLQTGDGNATYFLIAGGLTSNDPIYNNPNPPIPAPVPIINETTSMTYLGNSRMVNVYNRTSSSSGSNVYGSYSSYESLVTIWDQSSGILLEFKFVLDSSSTYEPYGTYSLRQDVDLVITDTNVYTPQPDFQITASPASLTFAAGSTGTSLITVQAERGFTGTVSLFAVTVSTLPLTGEACTLSSATAVLTSTTTSATSMVSCSGYEGSYTAWVSGTSGTLMHSVPITVTVTAGIQPDFNIATSTTGVTVLAGQTTTIGITVSAQNGFTGTVDLSDTITPSTGLSCTLSSNSVTLTSTTTSTSSISCSGSPGTYTVTVTSKSQAVTHTGTYTVKVNSAAQTPAAPASILGLAPSIFYSIIAAIIVAVAAAASVLALRSRKKPTVVTG